MGILDQAKQILQMRKEAKRLQNEMEKIQSTYENGGISVTFRGDFKLVSLTMTPESLEELKAGKTDRFITMFTNVINGGIQSAKQATQQHMAKMMNGSDMASMFGGGE